MMEENNDIFLAGGDVLVYLAEQMHKKYSTNCFFPLHASVHIFDDLP